jgi:hypothetical protein
MNHQVLVGLYEEVLVAQEMFGGKNAKFFQKE